MFVTNIVPLTRFGSAFLSTASFPLSSLRFFLMVTTTWSVASTSLRRSWLPSTKPCPTTMSTWRAPCSNPTWLLLDTPAHTSTATRRLPWQLLQPCAAPCPLQSLVIWTHNLSGMHTIIHTTRLSSYEKCTAKRSFFLLHRNHLPVWWPEWGGGLRQSKCHEPVPFAQALGSDLLVWPCPAGLRLESLGRQEGEWKSLPRRVCQESSGMCVKITSINSISWIFWHSH